MHCDLAVPWQHSYRFGVCCSLAMVNSCCILLAASVVQLCSRTLAAHTLLSARTHTSFGHAGSVTRHLQLLTGSAVKVDCLAMEPVPAGADGLPPVVHEMLTAPLLQREVS
jgi:p-hydroxybenzoic acid synthase